MSVSERYDFIYMEYDNVDTKILNELYYEMLNFSLKCSVVSQPGLTTHHQRSTLKKDQPMGQPSNKINPKINLKKRSTHGSTFK
jgi:hypothetical protein